MTVRHPYEALAAAEAMGWAGIETCPDIADYEPAADQPETTPTSGQD